jgi:predicted RNA methylase
MFISVATLPFLVIPMVKKFGHIPWMITPNRVSQQAFRKVIEMKRSSKLRIADLGSGDGRVCIEAAKLGMHATGFEVSLHVFFKT